MTPMQFHAMKHSPGCCRGAKDTFERVYGTPDPECTKCKAWERIRSGVERRMFA